jgi:hypothetical protein
MMTSNAVLSNRFRRESNESVSPFTLNFGVDCRRKNLQTAGWTDPMGLLCFPLSTPKRGPAVSIVLLSEHLGHDAVSKLIKR